MCEDAQEWIRANFQPGQLFTDMIKRPLDQLDSDITGYGCGFPCPPFSVLGPRRAFADVRAKVVGAMLKTISRCWPLYAVLENVGGLAGHMKPFQALLSKHGILSAYFVMMVHLNPVATLKAPVRRPRLYFCLVRQGACLTRDPGLLKAFVSAIIRAVHASAVPESAGILTRIPGCLQNREWTDRERAILKRVREQCPSSTSPVLVDISQSLGRNPLGVDVSPCLTTSSRLAFVTCTGTGAQQAQVVTARGKLLLHGIDLSEFQNPCSELHSTASQGMACIWVVSSWLLGVFEPD